MNNGQLLSLALKLTLSQSNLFNAMLNTNHAHTHTALQGRNAMGSTAKTVTLLYTIWDQNICLKVF